MRVVLDTNVILAAFATRGLCEAVMAVCLNSHELILSDAILGEVGRHLAGKFKMPATQAEEIIGFLREQAVVVEPSSVPAKACRDPDDCLVLGTAVAGKAACLVTGDADLISLGNYQSIAILTPGAFYDQLR